MLAKFELYHDGDSWCAKGIGIDIFTHSESLDKLVTNIQEAVEVHFEDEIHSGEKIKILTLSEFEVSNIVKTTSG